MGITKKRSAASITLLFAFAYFASYVTRVNFAAIISEIESETGFRRDLLAISLTVCSVTYGIGQIASGVLGDRFKPKTLGFIGLVTTSCMNLVLAFSSTPLMMAVVWGINGLAQSFMWPPIVKLMAHHLDEKDYDRGMVLVSFGSSLGSVSAYLVSPLIISVTGSWQWVFVVSAAIGLAAAAIWQLLSVDITPGPKNEEIPQETQKSRYSFFTPMMIAIMLSIALQGALRDGVTAWIPTLITESYGLDNLSSIISSVAIPIYSFFAVWFASKIHLRFFKNPITCAAVLFGGATAMGVIMLVFAGKSIILSVVCASLLTGAIHGVNLMLISMVPRYFKKSGNVSTVSGVLNSCTHIGSAVATYGFAVVSVSYGWNATILTWAIIAASGMALCAVSSVQWKKKMSDK